MKSTTKQLQLRLPPELKDWIAAQAATNVSSQNSEIIRAIRERMDSVEETKA
jgi:predicted HicB family RNase H-like nuclease